MKLFTVATKEEGYYSLLKQTALENGFSLKTLGWNDTWKGFAWKIDLYLQELKNCQAGEPVVCVDGYDVVVIGDAEEVYNKFIEIGHPILFSGQRYFPSQKRIQRLSDQLMSNSKTYNIGDINEHLDYRRPCMGLLIGYAENLITLFEQLQKIEREEKIGNDQILLNMFYLNNPNQIKIDSECKIFQNLWRTRGGFYGKTTSKDEKCEVELYFDKYKSSKRFRNKKHKTLPCFLHGPLNLDMGLLLSEIDISAPKLNIMKGIHYWKYSISYYIKRAIPFFIKWED